MDLISEKTNLRKCYIAMIVCFALVLTVILTLGCKIVG